MKKKNIHIDNDLSHKEDFHKIPVNHNNEIVYSLLILGGTYLYCKDIKNSLAAGVGSYAVLRMYRSHSVVDQIDNHKLHEIKPSRHLQLFTKY